MKSKLSYMLAAVVAMAVIGSGFVYAQSRGLSILEGIPGITLDEAQKAKLQARDAEHQKAMIKLHADHKIARVDLEAILKDRSFKKDAAEKQIRKVMAIETDMELNRLEKIHELRGVLTEAQWKVYAAHTGICGMGGGMGMMKRGCGMMGDPGVHTLEFYRGFADSSMYWSATKSVKSASEISRTLPARRLSSVRRSTCCTRSAAACRSRRWRSP